MERRGWRCVGTWTRTRIRFGKVERETLDVDGFLGKMSLVRIGFYPENGKRRVTFDYSLGTHLTDYLLVVTFDSSGQASDVHLES
jgi:hypothetical protein